MTSASESDNLLVRRIRAGEAEAWRELIARYEGRLLAFVRSRVRDRATAEDVVQETLVGLLVSLPNYDRRRPLEGYLFSIAAHKLTDHLRREGRRPRLPLAGEGSDSGAPGLAGRARAASSIVRSGERRGLEETALVAALADTIEHCRRQKQWQKLECLELLTLRGCSNQEVARQLKVSEQTVANWKFEFTARLRSCVRGQELPAEVFPELYPPP
jgi:RNA polymerase sigma-70 factor (ECF subfamily)